MYRISELNIQNLSSSELSSILSARMDISEQTILFFVNSNFVVKCQSLIPIINRNKNIFLVNDGIGLDIANKLINKSKFKENLNGTDYIPRFLSNLPSQRIVLIGSTKNDLEPAKRVIENIGHQVVGIFDGFEDLKRPNMIDELRALNPDIILVGMGNPLQEHWILSNYAQLPQIKLIAGVGALFVFLAQNKARAPELIRKLRMEWLFRLCLEPRRLLKRYTIDFIVFIYICLKNK